jgi:hypothetical protein
VPESDFEKPRFCSQCGQPIVVADARYCKSCGAPLTLSQLLLRNPGYSPVLALLLSIVPGVGQIYRGKPFKGILWFFGVTFWYGAAWPLGFVLHLICAANAAFAGAIHNDVPVR